MSAFGLTVWCLIHSLAIAYIWRRQVPVPVTVIITLLLFGVTVYILRLILN